MSKRRRLKRGSKGGSASRRGGVEREPNGQPKRGRMDYGPIEAQRQRLARLPKDSDPALSEDELGILHAYGRISRRSLDAGRAFARHWRFLYGKPYSKVLSYDGRKGGEPTDDAVARTESTLEDAAAVLKNAHGHAYDAVKRIAACDQSPMSEKDIEVLQAALHALGRHWYGYNRDLDDLSIRS